MPSQPAPLPPIKLELLALQLQGFRCCPCACEFITVASSCGSSSCFLLLWRSGKRKRDVRYRLDGARGLFSSTGAAAGVPREQNPAAVRHFSSKRLTPGLQRKGDTPERCSSPEEERRAPAPVPLQQLPPCGTGPVSTLTYHALHFGNNTAGRSGCHLLREVTRVENVVHGRPMLTVVQQLVMFRILKRGKRRNKDTRSERLLPIGRTETRTPLSLQLLMVKLEHLN